MVIKIIFIAFALWALARVMTRVRKRELSYALGTLGIVVWASVIVFTLVPSWLDRIAEFVGIGRGVDTAVYISILVIFYLLFKIFVRLEGLEDHLTAVVRKDALHEYHAKKRE